MWVGSGQSEGTGRPTLTSQTCHLRPHLSPSPGFSFQGILASGVKGEAVKDGLGLHLARARYGVCWDQTHSCSKRKGLCYTSGHKLPSGSLACPETHSIPCLSMFAKSLQRVLHMVMSCERIGKKENTAPRPQGRSITTSSGISMKHFWTVTHSKNTFTI